MGSCQDEKTGDCQAHAKGQLRRKGLAKDQDTGGGSERRLRGIEGVDVNHAGELQRLGERYKGDVLQRPAASIRPRSAGFVAAMPDWPIFSQEMRLRLIKPTIDTVKSIVGSGAPRVMQ